jgi:hypothetical protein
VVSPNQDNFEIRDLRSPIREGIARSSGETGSAVQKVAQHNKALNSVVSN